jgi:hypothetical protein
MDEGGARLFPVNTPHNRRKGQKETSPAPGPPHEPAQVARVAALAAQRHRAGTSLRELAKEMRVSKSAVDALVHAHDGHRRMPQPHVTWARLRAWYLRERQASGGALEDPVDMALVADQVLGDIPASDRPSAALQLLASVGEIYDRFDTTRPAWLRRLLEPADASEPSSPPA